MTYAAPLTKDQIMRTLFSYCMYLRRHGTVYLCSVPSQTIDPKNFIHVSKRCTLGLLLRSPTIHSTVTILQRMAENGYVSIELEPSSAELGSLDTERVVVVAKP